MFDHKIIWILMILFWIFQALDDPPQEYDFLVQPTNLFFVDDQGYLRLTTGNLDYETVPQYNITVCEHEI